MPKLSLFISSPGDVNEERVIAARVIARVGEEFASRVTLEPIFWEHEPMLMTETFQTQIQPPSETDIFIGILWARIGTRLPAHITRPDGSRYASGTEFEFEDAWAGFTQSGKPEILIYRKSAKPLISPDMPDFEARMAQKNALDAFARKWFQDEEGSFIAAFNPFENLAEFEERLESHLRKLLLRRFPSDDTDTHVRHITWHQGSPFRGLAPFRAEHAPVFFGRTRIISEVLAALRKNTIENKAFIMILGMSGSGKSSLVHAGILPMLTQAGVIEGVAAWRQAVFCLNDCGSDVLESLSKQLFAPEGLPLNEAAQRHSGALNVLLQAFLQAQTWRNEAARQIEYFSLKKDILSLVAACLHEVERALGAQAGQVRLVLVVEQFEELFLQENITPMLRKVLVELLHLLAHSKECCVVVTFRSDLYYRCAELPMLVNLLEGSGQYLLTPPNISELTQMIRLPAFAAGLQFETYPQTQQRLDEVLLLSMVANPESLALMSFTLDALYQQRDANGYLTFAAYEALGGIEGALAQRAETVFQHVSIIAQTRLPALMRTLITVSSKDATPMNGRRYLYKNENTDKALQELLDAFIEADLIVTGQDADGVAVARIAHNALLEYWPRLQHWLQENQHLLRLRVRLKDAAWQWQEEGRPAELLLSGGRALSNGEELLLQWRDALDPYLIEYIEASTAKLQRQKAAAKRRDELKLRHSRYLAAIFGVLAFFALIGGFYGYLGQESAQQQARIAEQAKLSAERHAQEAAELTMLAQQEKYLALRTQSQFLVSLAQQQTAQGNMGNGVLLALEALPHNVLQAKRPYLVEAEIALRDALSRLREYLVLRGHDEEVWDITFSKDGRYLLSASDDGTAHLWDAETGKLLRVLQGHQHQVWRARFHPDQRTIVTASLDHTARIWDALTGKTLHVLQGHTGELYFAAFSPDGRTIVTTSLDKTVRLWNPGTGQLLHILRGHQAAILSADFSPDGKRLVSISRDHTAHLWDVETGKLLYVFEGHTDEVNHAVFHPDGKRMVTASEDGSAREWDIVEKKLLHVFAHEQKSSLKGVVISPNGEYLLTYSSDKTAHLWNFQGQLLNTLYGHENTVTAAKFTSNSQFIITAGKDGILRLWQTKDGASVGVMAGHSGEIHALALSPDNLKIASVSVDHTVRLWWRQASGHLAVARGHQEEVRRVQFSDNNQRYLTLSEQLAQIWDTQTQKLVQAFAVEEEMFLSAELSPDGKTLLASQSDDQLYLWDVDSGKLLKQLAVPADSVNNLHFNHQGTQWVTVSMNGTVHLWQPDGSVQTLLGHQDLVPDAYFSPDDRRLITISRDHDAILWSLPEGKRMATLSGAKDILTYACFSPDSRLVLTVSEDGTGRLWNALNSEFLKILRGHEGGIFYANFSPDGKLVATASWDNSIRLWNTQSGKNEAVLNGHRDWVNFVVFTPDGQRLISASKDGNVLLWDLPTHQQLGILNPNNHNINKPTYSRDGNYLLTRNPYNNAVLWRVLPSAQAIIDYAQQAVPRRLTAAQRRQFFLDSE